MKYRLQDLIDMEHFQNLQDRLNEIYSFPSSIIDNEGNILTATAWQDICTQFHRKNKDSERLCIKSDQYIRSHIHEANPAVSYRCPHGLVDNATPIIIDGIHYGNFFTGQFFLEEPDMDFFKVQAKKYGFDEDAYLEAVRKVPIWNQKQLNNYLFFIKGLIAIISESGLKKLKEVETRKQIEESEELHRSILQTALDGFWLTDIKGQLIEVNDSYCSMSGYSREELVTMHISDLEAYESHQVVTAHMQKVVSKGSDRFESKHRRKDGTVFDVEVSVQFRAEDGGRCVTFLRDITERKRSEKALRNSEQKWRKILVETPQIGVALDAKAAIVFANKRFLQLTGWRAEDVLGRNWFDLFIPEEVREEVRAVFDKVIHARDTIGYSTYENEILTRAGERLNVAWSNVLTKDPSGAVVDVTCLGIDLTERKRAEEALRKSEEQYRDLFDNADELIQMVRPDGRLYRVNKKWLDTLGYTAEEVRNLSIWDIIRPDTTPHCERIFHRALLGETASSFEAVFLSKNGRAVPLEGTINCQLDDGTPVLARCILRDITERKRAEKDLRESEERFRASFMGNPNAVAISRQEDGVWLDANQAALDMFGYTREEAIGKSALSTNLWVDLHDLQRILTMLDRGEEVRNQEVQLRRKDGRLIIASVSVRPLTFKGIKHLLFITEDITERKQADEDRKKLQMQLTNAVELAHLGPWEYDVINDIFTFNDQFFNIFRTTIEEVGGYKMSSIEYAERFIHPEDRFAVGREIRKAIETTDPNFRGQLEHRMLYADGSTGYISVLFFIVKDTGGKTIGSYGVNQDITERKRIEERLQQSQKMEAIGTLAGGIAHDFNNILAAIMGYTELALDDIPENLSGRKHLEQVLKSGVRAKNLVQQILSFTRQTKQERKPIQLGLVIKETMEMLRATISTTIAFEGTIETETGTVLCDPTQIHQLLINLCGNAAHAMRERGGVLNVSLDRIDLDENSAAGYAELKPGTYNRISVTDTGEGMDKAILERIFEPFFTTKDTGEGTGMGLSVVHGIVKAHGGEITVYSELGKGSEFHVYMPVIEAEAEEKASIETETIPKGEEHVLFVDDEKVLTDIGRQMLERLGYKVTARTSSLEALEVFKAKPDSFHLVITDQTMPNMTGVDLAKEMLSIRPDIPIIICTGFSAQISEKKAGDLGVRRVLMKPLVAREVAEAIREVLDETEA